MSEVVEKPVISELAGNVASPVGLVGRLQTLVVSQKRNLQNLSVLVFINVLVAGIGFITKVKIANTLGKADFGLFSYGYAIASYGMVIIQFGLDRTFVRDLIHYPENRGQLVAASLVLKGSLFLLVTIALLIWKFFSTADTDLTWGVLLVALGNSMMGLELKSLYDAMGQFNRHAIYNFIQRCVYFLAVWIMVLVFPKQMSIYWLGIFTVVSVVLYLYMQIRWALTRIEISCVFENIISKTFHLAINNLIIWFCCLVCLSFGTINQLILKLFKGNEALGGYAAAWQIILIAILCLTQIARIGNPAMARVTKGGVDCKEKIQLIVKYSFVMFMAVLPVSVACICFPEYILQIVFNPEYVAAASALRILGFYVLIFSLGLVASQYVISARMEKLYFISVVFGGVTSILLCLILIPIHAESGAATALLISHGMTMSIYWWVCIMDIRK